MGLSPFTENLKLENLLKTIGPSPDYSKKPGAKKTNFYYRKTATGGSSFYGIEK